MKLRELADVACAVLTERVGDMKGGAFPLSKIPSELDANAAASRFVRRHCRVTPTWRLSAGRTQLRPLGVAIGGRDIYDPYMD